MSSILLRLGGVLAILAVFFFAEQYIESLGYARAKLECATAIETQKTEAAIRLSEETRKVLDRERELASLKAEQEQQDAKHQNTIVELQARLRAAAGPAGRLRDPNAPAGCGGGSGRAESAPAAGAPDRPADGAEAGGLLSTELSGLLQRLQFEADTINAAYASCRPTLMQEQSPPP